MHELLLYGRAGCLLCDEARALLVALLDERTRAGLPVPTIVERDIAADPSLHRAFFDRIPVIELDDRRLELTVSAGRLRRLLAETLDATSAGGGTR